MKLNKSEGITLIVLIVTIVVMLILSGIVLYNSIGDEGIINRAKRSKEKYDTAEIEEKIDAKISSIELDPRKDLFTQDTYSEIETWAKKIFGESTEVALIEDNISKNLEYSFKINGYTYIRSTNQEVLDVFVPEKNVNYEKAVRVEGYRIDVSGKLGLSIYFSVDTNEINDIITIKLKHQQDNDGEEIESVFQFDLSNSATNGIENFNGKKYFYITQYVNSRSMSRPIRFEAFYNGQSVSDEYTYSVKEFADEIIRNQIIYVRQDKKALIDFIKAMIYLGGEMQDYREELENIPENERDIDIDEYLTAQDKEMLDAKIEGKDLTPYAPYSAFNDNSEPIVDVISSKGLELDYEVFFRMYANLDLITDTTVEKVDGKNCLKNYKMLVYDQKDDGTYNEALPLNQSYSEQRIYYGSEKVYNGPNPVTYRTVALFNKFKIGINDYKKMYVFCLYDKDNNLIGTPYHFGLYSYLNTVLIRDGNLKPLNRAILIFEECYFEYKNSINNSN